MNSIPIQAGRFAGWAIEAHTASVRMASGSIVTRRSHLGDLLYRYGYRGESGLLPEIAAGYSTAIRELFPGVRVFDLVVAVPAPVSSPRHRATVALTAEICRLTGIASGQFAVGSSEQDFDPVRRTRGRRAFSFATESAAGFFSGKRVLVIDDLVRTGESVRAFCTLLADQGRAAEVKLLVATTTSSQV